MNTTRREFIKLLTGTVVAISLPVGLFSGNKKENVTEEINYDNIEFTLERIDIVALTTVRGYAIRGMGKPKDKRISPVYFAVRIDDKNNYQ